MASSAGGEAGGLTGCEVAAAWLETVWLVPLVSAAGAAAVEGVVGAEVAAGGKPAVGAGSSTSGQAGEAAPRGEEASSSEIEM